MRSQIVAILLLPTLFSIAAVGSSREPEVRAPISREDVRQIIRALRDVTPKPVTFIGTVYNTRWPHHTRSDIVSVLMGPDEELTGDSYKLEKKDGRWQITGKGHWIH
jgi:hypothetical protein